MDNPDHNHMRATLLAAKGEAEKYRRLCERMTPDVRKTALNPFMDYRVTESMAKDCLILPSSVVDLKAVAALANMAVAGGSNSSVRCCKALAEFRMGHDEEALKWAQLAAQSRTPTIQAQALAIMAMSQFKLNQVDQARATLADCNKVIESKLPKLEKPGVSDLGKDWREWIIAHTLQSEAKRMIEPASATAPANPQAGLK
jgi:hypothetical protein